MTLEIAAGTVSFGIQGDDVARVQQALQALGRDIPLSESEARVLGPGTSAVVRALQQELDLTPTGTVDASRANSPHVFTQPGDKVLLRPQASSINRAEGADIARAAASRRALNDPRVPVRPNRQRCGQSLAGGLCGRFAGGDSVCRVCRTGRKAM
jgi:peptidoglycan hydrolase-like protein with peptidoglycan-binding domain